MVLGGLADSAYRRSIKKQAAWHDRAGALAGITTNTLEPVVIATCSAQLQNVWFKSGPNHFALIKLVANGYHYAISSFFRSWDNDWDNDQF